MKKNKKCSVEKRFRYNTLPIKEHWHLINVFLLIYDFIVTNGAYLLALLIRYDCRYSNIPSAYINTWIHMIVPYTIFCVVIFRWLHLYHSIWRFASFDELVRVVISSLITLLFQIFVTILFFQRMPVSYYILGFGFQMGFLVLIRFSYRFVLLERARIKLNNEKDSNYRNVMIIGAGSSGQIILRDLRFTKKLNYRVKCFIDDNSNKWGRYIDGIEVVGGRDKIMECVNRYDINTILMAIPSASAMQKKEILDICKETGCELKTLPGLYQLVNGEVRVGMMKQVEVEDLLGREPVRVDLTEIFNFLNDKVILVTGGGGSIGSELSRQIAQHNPKQLIILDIYENNAHAIQLELRDKYPDLNLVVLIGSVRDTSRLNDVFRKYRPDVVYHAAAHKHVPLMEDSPCESIKNNVLGTYNTGYMAMKYGCKRFVLISTDKAVNPTNIMGASKRLCEMVIQSFANSIRNNKADTIPYLQLRENEETVGPLSSHPETEFVAVRFGNVLGSNGSVVPRFKEQIAKGGPVTVTHPDIIRYFMTIPEAVSLVLQAGTYAKGGEIFVLDMGEPVKIDTLARNMIKLSGFKPDVDIEIKYTGLRPGEKLYEEKLMNEEGMTKTANELIFIGKPIDFDEDQYYQHIQELTNCIYHEREKDIRDLVSRIVPTYQVPDKVNSRFIANIENNRIPG